MTLAKETTACNLCGAVENSRRFDAYDHYTKELFAIDRCTACGHYFTAPRPAVDAMDRYYPPIYYGSDGMRFRGRLENLVHLFRRRLAVKINATFASPGRVLEIGAGRGSLLAELKSLGWDVQGTELSPLLAEAARKRFGITVHCQPDVAACAFPDAHFDLVICYHVLEHIIDPVAALREVRRILRPGGTFILAVPNFDSFVASFAGPAWFGLNVPRHLSHFTPANLKSILDREGFDVFRASSFSLEQDMIGFAASAMNRAGFPFNAFYMGLYEKNTRRQFGLKGLASLGLAVIMPVGLILTALAFGIAPLTAALGKGSTLEYWTKAR